MLDPFHEKKKKEYELKVLELMIGRCYPVSEISEPKKKLSVCQEAEVFYRDRIHGVSGSDASFHDVKSRFPNLSERIKTEISVFSDKMAEAGEDIPKIEAVIRNFGLNVNFSDERLKSLLKNR